MRFPKRAGEFGDVRGPFLVRRGRLEIPFELVLGDFPDGAFVGGIAFGLPRRPLDAVLPHDAGDLFVVDRHAAVPELGPDLPDAVPFAGLAPYLPYFGQYEIVALVKVDAVRLDLEVIGGSA